MKFLEDLCIKEDEISSKVMFDEYWYLLRITGLYPKFDKPKWIALSTVQFIVNISICVYHMIILAITASKLTDSKTEMFQSIHHIMVVFACFYIIILFHKYRAEFSKIHRLLGTGLFHYGDKTDEFKETLISDLNMKKRLLLKVFFIYFTILAIILLLLEKFINSFSGEDKVIILSPNLPITLWSPFDTNYLFGWAITMFLFGLICLNIVAVCATCEYSLFVMCASLAMEFKLLIHSINKLPERALHLYTLLHGEKNITIDALKTNQNLSNCYRVCLRQNIIHHQNIIQMFYLYRRFLGLALWIIFGILAATIAFSGVLVVKGEGKIGSMILSGLFCFAEVTVCFYYVHCCSMITAESMDLTSTLYSTEWMSANKNVIQMINIMMTRSQIPLIMNYRNLTNFDYVTYASIMNTAYSYFNLLLAFS